MPPFTFTRGFSAVSRVYFLARELVDADTRMSNLNRSLTRLSDAGALLATEGLSGIDSCRTALAELQELFVGLGPTVSTKLATALTEAVSIFTEPADILASTGLYERPKYMHEGFAYFLAELDSTQPPAEAIVNPYQVSEGVWKELLERYAEH